jgi:SAM-dependent methyltransferase
MVRETPSARRAAALYDRDYADRYRAHDDTLTGSAPYQGFVTWLQRTCERFQQPIDVLELGCGTGRYFSALTRVGAITGIDASAEMLAHARSPIQQDRIAAPVTLVQGDLFTHPFAAGSFDLIYAIGVLAEHAPLNATIVERVHGWLRPGGCFAFSTVHPDSPSIGVTVGRAIGRAVQPLTFGSARRRLRGRLLAGGLYADEAWIAEVLQPWFAIESLERFVSEAHLHCLCVARRAA